MDIEKLLFWPLAAATLLGGLSAVAYFWEKRSHFFADWLDQRKRAPAIPLNAASLFAYANGHPRPLRLTKEIAARRGFELKNFDAESAWLNERVQVLQIRTVRELDDIVRKHSKVAVRMTDFMSPQNRMIDSGFVLGCVTEVGAIQRFGRDGLRTFFSSLRYSPGGAARADEVFSAYRDAVRRS